MATHPKSIWIRQVALADAVHDFFATRVLGPHRRELLESDLTATTDRGDRDDSQHRTAELHQHIDTLQRRQRKLFEQLEDPDEDDAELDPETRRAFRQGIQRRFAELATQIRQTEAESDRLHLKIIYNRERHEATLRVTITADAVDSLTSTIHTVVDRRTTTIQNIESHTASAAQGTQPTVSHVLGALGRIRTASARTRTRRELLVSITVEIPRRRRGQGGDA